MNKPDIHSYQSASSFLEASIVWLRDRNPKLSIRWFARRIGLRSHSIVIRYLNGTSTPSNKTVDKIATLLELSSEEATRLRLLCKSNRNESGRGQTTSPARTDWVHWAVDHAIQHSGSTDPHSILRMIQERLTYEVVAATIASIKSR